MFTPTDEIKNRVDIADLIQEYLKLTPAGINNYKANCPFHHEKTPSFIVSRDKQIWHCFGCGEGGDIFTWLQKIEGIDFPEALKILAKKANVQIDWQEPQYASEKNKLLDICRLTTEYWHNLLANANEAQSVRDYLQSRSVENKTMIEWQLGWSRDSWDDLLNYLKQNNFTESEIFNAGLTVKNEQGKYYDRFRNRLIFPIHNHHGQVIGFTGRTMSNEEAKYINTPQTQIYNKSQVLFGLDKAKTAIRKADYLIIVEGNMDVISASAAGTKNVIGVSGTALTSEQINLIQRFTNNVMISFDADAAGEKAALRGLDLAWQMGLNVKVIKLLAGKDPDECIRQDRDLWLESVRQAVNIMDYYFQVFIKDKDLNRSDHKKKIAAELLPIIAKLPDQIERSHYLQKLSNLLNVSERILADKLRLPISQDKKNQSQPDISLDSSLDSIKFKLAEGIVGILLNYPEKIGLAVSQLLPEDLIDQELSDIYKSLVIYYNGVNSSQINNITGRSNLHDYLEKQRPAWLNRLTTLELLATKDFSDLSSLELDHELEQRIQRLKKEARLLKINVLTNLLKQAEAKDDQVQIDLLLAQINQCHQDLKNLS